MTMLNLKRVAESFTNLSGWVKEIRKAVPKNMVASENSQTSSNSKGGELQYLSIEKSTSKKN